MLSENTVTKLHEMKLSVMAKAFREQMGDAGFSDMAFEERLGLIVDAEWATRKSNRLTRLATCNYVEERYNIIILSASGNGKTYLSNAFGMAANRNFYAAKYVRLPEMLGELAIARGNGGYHKVVKLYKKVSLLILDEWLLFPINAAEARDVLDIVNARHKTASTIFCSQFAPEGWYDKIGEPAVADAICDRIVHDSYTIFIDGDGMRKRKGINEA